MPILPLRLTLFEPHHYIDYFRPRTDPNRGSPETETGRNYGLHVPFFEITPIILE
ncbi:hypothetical protein D3C76_1864900 [compost metagenome]